MENVLKDVRYGFRGLLKRKGFAAILDPAFVSSANRIAQNVSGRQAGVLPDDLGPAQARCDANVNLALQQFLVQEAGSQLTEERKQGIQLAIGNRK